MSSRAGHSKRKCFTVSYGWGQSAHTGACSGFILFKCILSCTCCERSLKIMTWSFLPRELIGSLMLGWVKYGKIALPLLEEAQVFSHSILVFDFMICLHVLSDTGKFGCSCDAPFLASLSADSFPGMSQWLGIHWSVILIEKSSIKFDIASLRFLMELVVCLSFFRAWRTDLEFVKMIISILEVLFGK